MGIDRTAIDVQVRPLRQADLAEADRIFKLAFGTFFGLAEPEQFAPGQDFVATRWRADPSAAFVAEVDGRLAGSNFAANWGSFGFFGPLSVLPEFWDRGVAQALLAATLARFDSWGIAHRGLFTFPQSPKHIHLYEKHGFTAGCLTAIMTKTAIRQGVVFVRLTGLADRERENAIRACAALTGMILPGLDVRSEIEAVVAQGLGDTVLVYTGAVLAGFAVCHCGAGTEAGPDVCLVKFGGVRPSPDAGADFDRLLAACEALAAEYGLRHLGVGMNMGRTRAYRQLRAAGYRTQRLGVAMETQPIRTYNRPDVYVIDDWR